MKPYASSDEDTLDDTGKKGVRFNLPHAKGSQSPITLPDQVDAETDQWPVSGRLREELDKIKFEYRVNPLTVYVHDKFIEPTSVEDTIKGALVELHFELHHYCIRRKSEDSFNATIEQIMLIRPGQARPATGYKRKNIRDGPIRLNPCLSLIKHTPIRTQDEKENEGESMSDKRRGKQKANDSEDGVEDEDKQYDE